MAILDDVTNEKVAYSLRKLRSAYTGSAVKVRRDQDSVEADIGFDSSGDFDVTAYNNHLAGSTPASTIGYVTTWYDQSGAAQDFIQTVASAQPFMALSDFGINSRPSIRTDISARRYLSSVNLSALTAAELFVAIRATNDPGINSESQVHWLMGTSGNSSLYPWTLGRIWEGWGSTTRTRLGNPTQQLDVARVYNLITTSSEYTARIDDAQLFTTATNTVGFRSNCFVLGSTGSGFDGVMSELIIFDAKLSTADHDSVFSDLEAYYLVVTPPVASTGGILPIFRWRRR